MKTKHFKIAPENLLELVTGLGACYATDHITVEGKLVGYMYREEPDGESDFMDSGWRFFSGEESQDYVDDVNNTMIYDLSTIANCDPSIIDYLDAPYNTQWERDMGSNSFREVQE